MRKDVSYTVEIKKSENFFIPFSLSVKAAFESTLPNPKKPGKTTLPHTMPLPITYRIPSTARAHEAGSLPNKPLRPVAPHRRPEILFTVIPSLLIFVFGEDSKRQKRSAAVFPYCIIF
jgi:hypothetical protein